MSLRCVRLLVIKNLKLTILIYKTKDIKRTGSIKYIINYNSKKLYDKSSNF